MRGDVAGWNYVSFRDDNIRVDHKWRDGEMVFQGGGAAVPEGEERFRPFVLRSGAEVNADPALRAWRGIRTVDASLRTAVRQVRFPRRTDIPAYRDRLLEEQDALVRSLADCPLDFRTFLPLYMKYLTSPEYPLGYRWEYLREEQLGVTQLRDQDEINRDAKELAKLIEKTVL